MSLCNDYTNAHKVTEEALMVRYQLVEGTTVVSESGTKIVWWHVRRFATKSYRFVGMTESAARACAAAKVTQYTRSRKIWSFQNEDGYASTTADVYQADITAVHDSGQMWHCQIDVNEDDEVYYQQTTTGNLPELSTLFPNVTTDYDED